MNEFTLNNGKCQINKKGCCRNTALKLSVVDWMCDLPETIKETDMVEVQFKNTRKGYYLNSEHLPLEKGTIVAVESSPGHDIGEVTLVGKLVLLQIKRNRISFDKNEIRKVYRIASEGDIEKWQEAKSREQETMIKSRQLASNLGLSMKIGDVEYQGDGNKAIFYYIADDRVDFRQLIKVFAEAFRVRIEMKQIGARQEAGRIGGIGPCGRELCCTTWKSNFSSVSTSAARIQDLSLNPQKLAGQCAKLKCCMNYELDTYTDAQKEFPRRDIQLETKDSTYYLFKVDTLAGTMTYSTSPTLLANLVTITAQRAKEIININKRGEKPDRLDNTKSINKEPTIDYKNVVGQDELTRFDKKKSGNDNKRRNNKRRNKSNNKSSNKDTSSKQ